ncbi:zinc dependent phospholipase C family protein [Sporomusa aerivorans]|uniref:zinc dependent phospholipase C family protein n=1 Tax=Sporomusa aerivorans TaxID=204936 RepID=UPI00352A054B
MRAGSLPAISTGVAGTKLLLAAVSPLQTLLDRPSITHEFLNRQALIILQNDGLEHYAGLLKSFLVELNDGVYWADGGWKNISHYYEPLTNKGLWHFATALDSFSLYFEAALKSFRQQDIAGSIFLLGAAAHLLQDVCVPHHARAKLFSGHKEYENWVRTYHTDFAVNGQGLYSVSLRPHELLISNAVAAADYLDWVTEENHTRFHTVTTSLLTRAQRSTAGLFERFCFLAGIGKHSTKTIVA